MTAPRGAGAAKPRHLPPGLKGVHGTLVDVSALAGRAKSAIQDAELTGELVGELAEAARLAVLQCYWIVDHPEVRDQVR
ncbi:hypothetical protein [Actinokineospora sp.]|uniref:hypothetical protein n=1 Tax=Actinokineospora sp. TaxID=1872133 RepID=UPI003D6C228C